MMIHLINFRSEREGERERGSTGEELAGGGIRLKMIGRVIFDGGDEVGIDSFETTLRCRCGIHDAIKTGE